MAYDTELAERIESVMERWDGITRKAMFGGVAYLLRGNMCVGVLRDNLILRVGEETASSLKTRPGVTDFDITGRPMVGWVMIAPDGYRDDAVFTDLLRAAREFAAALPAK